MKKRKMEEMHDDEKSRKENMSKDSFFVSTAIEAIETILFHAIVGSAS